MWIQQGEVTPDNLISSYSEITSLVDEGGDVEVTFLDLWYCAPYAHH